jgi:hypothetical protein
MFESIMKLGILGQQNGRLVVTKNSERGSLMVAQICKELMQPF